MASPESPALRYAHRMQMPQYLWHSFPYQVHFTANTTIGANPGSAVHQLCTMQILATAAHLTR